MTPIDTFELPPVPSLVTSLDWHETIKRFARDSILKYLEESGFARHCSRSDAWGEVVAVLDEVAPGWRECKSTGAACAVAAIRKLADGAALAPKKPRPFPCDVDHNVLLAIRPIFKALDEVLPGWNTAFNAPERNAAAAIRKLAEDAKRPATGTRPFDLEAAKRGEPIVTRDGKKARFVAHVPDAKDRGGRVVVMIAGHSLPTLHYDDGTCISRNPDLQLMMEP